MSLTHQAHSVLQRSMVAMLLLRVLSRLGSDRLAPAPVQRRTGVRVCAERVYNDSVQCVQLLFIVVAPATPEQTKIGIVARKPIEFPLTFRTARPPPSRLRDTLRRRHIPQLQRTQRMRKIPFLNCGDKLTVVLVHNVDSAVIEHAVLILLTLIDILVIVRESVFAFNVIFVFHVRVLIDKHRPCQPSVV